MSDGEPKPMSGGAAERLDRFMARANALYYAGNDPFADFTTAPEISQVFGETLALWVVSAWHALGAPDPVLLVEAGPGRGTLMSDVLRVLAKIAPPLAEALQVHFIETSPRLRALQAGVRGDAVWHERFNTVPSGPMILLANEFLDALPIRQFVRRDGRWAERFVAAGAWVEQVLEDPAIVPLRPGVADGQVVELNEASRAFIRAVASRAVTAPSASLILDYGPMHSGAGDTLQAIARKRMSHPLAAPGSADLTAHVDFADLAEVARAAGARVGGPATQGRFLTDWGIELRTRMLTRAAPARAGELHAATQRLIAPQQMGTLFKVMTVTTPGLHDLLAPPS